jgi:Protein tyrosine and serine/threonine kinase
VSTTEAGRLTITKPDGSDGLSFQAVIEATRRLDELSCARVVGQVAEAVHAAQKGGQPLGTVTPAAIRVGPDGSVRLAPGASAARYTAPEKLRGGAGDRRTDVFSLGVVLWEALAHEPLFDGAGDEAIKRAVLAGAIRPPSEYNANVPAELDAICQRALATEPANRYQSAKVMAAEIDAVLGDAGYPESNDAIASYVARALAAETSKPAAPGGKTAPLPVAGLAPAPAARPASKTLQPMALTAAPTPASSTQPPAASRSANASQPPPSGTIPPASRSSRGTRPPAKAAASAATPGTLRSSSATQPPPPSTIPPAPASAGPSSATQPSAAAAPPSAGASASSASSASPVWTSPTGTSLSPFTASRPPAQTVQVGSWTEPEPATMIDAKAPAWDDGPVRTEVRGSMYPAAGAAHPPTRSPLATTAFLGSNAIEPAGGAGGTHVGVPPALVTPAPSSRARHATDSEPRSFAPPEMPASRGSQPPVDPKHTLPVPFRPSHPQPPLKESIATAATAETPHLGAEPPAEHVSTRRGLAPGMMVAPAAPSRALPTADNEFEDERHADPVEVIALQHPEKGRDVLAGWGWSTGTTEAITDDEDIHDTARAGRKRLVVTIGAALAVVAAIAIVAFAFRGSKQPTDDATAQRSPVVSATAPVSTTAPLAAPATTAPSPGVAAPPPDPTPPAPTPPTTPEVKPGSDPAPAPAVVVDPPKPAVVDSPKPVVVDPPKPAVVDPPKPAVVDPPKPAVVDPPKPAVVDPPKPAVADPPKPAPKHEPPKLAATKPPEAPKPASHKPPEPKKPVEAVRHAPPPERVARAPIDPYGGAPDKPRVDPATAYKSGLQQYARGDTTGALATFRGSLSSNPGYAPTWRGIGLVYEKLGNKGQARSAFKRYLQLSPGANDADQIRDRLERLGS